MKLPIWPGLALAGGVVIAAIIALLLIGASGPTGGGLPDGGANPGDTRLFPSHGAVAGEVRREPPRKRPKGVTGGGITAPGGSAAEFEYGVHGNRGFVLGGP